MQPSDGQLIDSYKRHMLGVGNLGGSFWFIGPRAGGDESEVVPRAFAYSKVCDHDCQQVIDYKRYEAALSSLGIPAKWSVPGRSGKVPLQPTYRSLMRLWFGFHQDEAPTLDQLREFQAGSFLSSDGPAAHLELGPGCAKRETGPLDVNDQIIQYRSRCLASLIQAASNKVFVFYGNANRESWLRLMPSDAAPQFGLSFEAWYHPASRSFFAHVPHPNTRGLKATDWHSYGRQLRSLVTSMPSF